MARGNILMMLMEELLGTERVPGMKLQSKGHELLVRYLDMYVSTFATRVIVNAKKQVNRVTLISRVE